MTCGILVPDSNVGDAEEEIVIDDVHVDVPGVDDGMLAVVGNGACDDPVVDVGVDVGSCGQGAVHSRSHAEHFTFLQQFSLVDSKSKIKPVIHKVPNNKIHMYRDREI